MERLYFACPVTGLAVDVGIDSELSTLLRIRDQEVRAHCPHCGERHYWDVRDAHLEKAVA